MRIAIGLAILLATASLAHAEVGIYTGHGTIEAIKWVGTPDAPPMYRAFRGEYDGPMRASIEQRPNEERDCDRSLPMTIVAGVTLELGTWLNFQTGETGEASGGFYGRGVREDCYNPIGWVSLGPAGPSSQFVGISVSTLNGTQASVSIRTYNTLMDYGDAQFTGTRSEVYVNVEPKVLDLSSAGGRVKAELWTDGTISIDEIALTSIRLGGAQSSSIRIEGERIVAHFPERGAGTDLSVGPAVPLTGSTPFPRTFELA